MNDSGPYPPQNCPCRYCGIGSGGCRYPGGHGGGGVQPGGLTSKTISDIETFVSSFIENLSVAIAVKLKALEVLPQNSSPDLSFCEAPLDRRLIRPLAEIAAGTATDKDRGKLAELLTEKEKWRKKVKVLSGNDGTATE